MAARARKQSAPTGPTWDQVTLAPIVLIKAGEPVLGQRAQERLVAQARQADPATELTRIDAASYEAHQLDMVTSPSLFGEPRLVLIENLEHMSDALLTDMLAYVKAPAADVYVVATHRGGNRGKKLLDAIAASPYPVVNCPALKNARDKNDFLRTELTRAGRKAEPAAIAALVDALGNDVMEMSSALSQLIADTQGTITADHVNTYYAGRIEATGFTVADCAVKGDVAGAITALRHAISTGVDPVPIVSALAMKIRTLARVAAVRSKGGSVQSLGLAPWQIDRASKELAGWSDDALATSLIAIAQADSDVKGGARDAVYAVERAVITTCRARIASGRRR